ncbi:hypothetical protein HYFRA_00002463 [Hymenoscyphus fraxineus]|uniref:NAD-dependent epimerase/dehydratase domain-containing protein n=1 Tax=Hymenoscyphus fraxineus TaxID=746836 RepID=A0A9N9L5V5_9HELO|nr:hypothetical protein HYFRA_00002463 [Hymenoscyphus fraxineus]
MPPDIAKGSTILVTGCNGFIASHIVDQLLTLGYQVRGTTRDLSNIKLLSERWEKTHGGGRFEGIRISNIAEEGVFDGCLDGISGIIHVASNVSMSSTPSFVIPETTAGCLNLLRAAHKHPEIKSFVYTSSSLAASPVYPDVKLPVDFTTWNEIAIHEAEGERPKGSHVYAASKALSERALWEFVDEERPGFRVNTILPDVVTGRILDKSKEPTHSGNFALRLMKGERLDIPLYWFIDVQDTALLHIAALLNPKVDHERILAFGGAFTWNDILDIIRKLRPSSQVVENYIPNFAPISTSANERGLELLRSIGKEGWTSLEESVKNNLEGW